MSKKTINSTVKKLVAVYDELDQQHNAAIDKQERAKALAEKWDDEISRLGDAMDQVSNAISHLENL